MTPTRPSPRPARRRVLTVVVVATIAASAFAGAAHAGSARFTDVGPGHAFAEPIGFMADTGIAGGYPDGTYRPGAPVTRQAMAAFIHRANSFTIESTHESISQAEWARAEARCSDPAHRVIAGGGGAGSTIDVFTTESRPSDDARGWIVGVETENDETHAVTISVYAICGPIDVAPLS